jgi:ribonuclease/clavin/mitogillin
MTATIYESLFQDVAPKPAKIRASAAVVPWRRNAEGRLEVYWILRSPSLAFMGGWHAFPGGGLDRADAELTLEADAPLVTFTAPAPGLSADEQAALGPDLPQGLVQCALRELFEECGLLLEDGMLATGVWPDLEAERHELLAGSATLAALAAARGWRLSGDALVFAGRWLTPQLGPIRFDNRFFLLHWPAERALQPSIMPGELIAGEWIEPAAALARWRSEPLAISPPIQHFLRVLGEDGVFGLRRLLETAEVDLGPERRIELRPGIVLIPLRTPTLPPAAHTNCFLLGERELILVDPATPFPEEQERLLAILRAVAARGQRIGAIFLTHHHADHVGAVERCRQELGVPVAAHRATAERLAERGIAVDRLLQDGELIELDGDPLFRLRVLHTPGHTQGHLCFYDEAHGSLIAGDLLSSLSTIVIDPPEGSMSAYLDSLERMAVLAPRALFPSHGPLLLDGAVRLRSLREHRLAREAKVLAAWRKGQTTARAMVAEVYDDTPPALHPIGLRQVEAHLERLRQLGSLDEA